MSGIGLTSEAEPSKPAENEPTLVESVVCEYRADNDYWLRERAICSVPCGDLPHGVYFGRDRDLFQLCLEIRAISWKMSQLRLKIGPNPPAAEEQDDWSIHCDEYHRFCNLTMPLYENRLGRLADLVPHTLHGLAAKAAVIQSEYLVSSDGETTATQVVRSIFRDIAGIMGDLG